MANDNVFDFPHLGASSGTLKVGMRSAEVADLQRNLQRLGFVGIKADGAYDQTLAQIVALVQRALVRPETGEVDPFIDASITRALDNAQSMEALRIGVVAKDWSQRQAADLATQPQRVQVVQDDQPFYVKSGFWLSVAGAVGLYFLIKRADVEPPPIPMGEIDDEGVEDPEDFLAGHDKPKRKPRKRKKKALAGPPEVLPDDADLPDDTVDVTPAGDPPPDDAPAPAPAEAASPGVSEAPKPRKRRRTPKRDPETGAFLPKEGKPKKTRKRKSRALAESAAAPEDEIQGEAGDPDLDPDDIEDIDGD